MGRGREKGVWVKGWREWGRAAHDEKGGGEGLVLTREQRQLELIRKRTRRFGEKEERGEG